MRTFRPKSLQFDLIRSHTRSFAKTCCAAMVGVVNAVARCQTWKFIIAGFGARQELIQN